MYGNPACREPEGVEGFRARDSRVGASVQISKRQRLVGVPIFCSGHSMRCYVGFPYEGNRHTLKWKPLNPKPLKVPLKGLYRWKYGDIKGLYRGI